MRTRELLREARTSARAQKVPTTLVALIVAAMCVTTIVTVGRAAAATTQVQERLDSAGTRLLTIADISGTGLIGPTIVSLSGALSTVERAVGTTTPTDYTNGAIGPGGTKVPGWGIIGEIDAVARVTSGRAPRTGEALISEQALNVLGLDTPVGFVSNTDTQLAIVGTFTARSPFEQYAAGLIYPTSSAATAQSLFVVATRAQDTATVQRDVLAMIAPTQPADLQISSPVSLAEIQTQVTSDLGSYSHGLLYGLLGAGALLNGVVVTADILVRRKDIGRRRALGADRATTIALIITQTTYTAILGATIGTIAGYLTATTLGIAPPLEFALGTAILAVLAATTGALAPSIAAARRDPLAVLRTP